MICKGEALQLLSIWRITARFTLKMTHFLLLKSFFCLVLSCDRKLKSWYRGADSYAPGRWAVLIGSWQWDRSGPWHSHDIPLVLHPGSLLFSQYGWGQLFGEGQRRTQKSGREWPKKLTKSHARLCWSHGDSPISFLKQNLVKKTHHVPCLTQSKSCLK